MIYVCDSIMGSGKTSAAINYMNSNTDKRFLYVTPYLDEVARVKEQCSSCNFVEPDNEISEYHYRKSEHLASLLENGENVVTTHQSFKAITPKTIASVKKWGYTLIFDESTEVVSKYNISREDLDMLVNAGYLIEENGEYRQGKAYGGRIFGDILSLPDGKTLSDVKKNNKHDAELWGWLVSPSLVQSFSDVYILTYMFEGQSLNFFMQINKLPFEYVNVAKTEDGGCIFSQKEKYTPEYAAHLKDKIHILDKTKLNNIGNNKNALSMAWFEKNPAGVKKLRANIWSCFNYIWKGQAKQKEWLWGSYKSCYGKLCYARDVNSFLVFNAKATNEYVEKKYLVYAANPYMNVADRQFFQKKGAVIDDDAYSLSVMIQWIWRSAIRVGEDIHIYIPSKRMRDLLIRWMDELAEGGLNEKM